MTTEVVFAIAGIALFCLGIFGRKIKVQVKEYNLSTDPLDRWQRLLFAIIGLLLLMVSIVIRLRPITEPVSSAATTASVKAVTETSLFTVISANTLAATNTAVPTATPTFTFTPTNTPAPICVLENFESTRQMNWWSPDSNVFIYKETNKQAHNGNQSLEIAYSKTDIYQFLAAEMPPGLCDFTKADTLQVWVYGKVDLLLKLEDRDGKQVEISPQSTADPDSWTLKTFNYASAGNIINLGKIKNIFFFPAPGDKSANGVFFLDDITLFPYSFAFIPAGEFTMGNNSNASTQPAHRVWLDSYWIDRAPVTNLRYEQCIKAGVCTSPLGPYHWSVPIYPNDPVVRIQWVEAEEYCQWIGLRLPTEAEWEKAMRGPYAILLGNNPEWVSDWYSNTYYAISPYINPIGPAAETYEGHVLRSGLVERSWTHRVTSITTAYSYGDISFRCACSQIVVSEQLLRTT